MAGRQKRATYQVKHFIDSLGSYKVLWKGFYKIFIKCKCSIFRFMYNAFAQKTCSVSNYWRGMCCTNNVCYIQFTNNLNTLL